LPRGDPPAQLQEDLFADRISDNRLRGHSTPSLSRSLISNVEIGNKKFFIFLGLRYARLSDFRGKAVWSLGSHRTMAIDAKLTAQVHRMGRRCDR
ncbi:MAG: hypothetical protein AAGC83_12935, partial [Pseudomonadota bacterium]